MEFNKKQKRYMCIKRILDLVGSIFGILFCFIFLWSWVIPINLIIMKGKPFFVAKRYGKNGIVFNMLKFRSMLPGAPILPPNDFSIEQKRKYETKFGRFLRETSIDETLQLFNIFLGQMSFIGPRPGSNINEDYLFVARKNASPSPFLVRPGITGLAQTKLKRGHKFQQKVKYDSLYVQKIGFILDLKIFLDTFKLIFHADNN